MLFQNLGHDFETLETEAEAYATPIQCSSAKVKLPLNVICMSSPSFGYIPDERGDILGKKIKSTHKEDDIHVIPFVFR